MRKRRFFRGFSGLLAMVAALVVWGPAWAQPPIYEIEQGVALADRQNPEIAIARKKLEAARGGLIEARAGYLPSVISSGFADKRQTQNDTRLRDEDYNASIRALQNLYTGGAVTNQLAIAQLNLQIQELELQALTNRVAMDTRMAFHELLLNRAKVRVREQSVGVLQEETKSQQERFRAGIVGNLNVRRAEVALANEQPELINSETQVKNSYLRLSELLGIDTRADTHTIALFEIAGDLQYQPRRPDLNECLARADTSRPEIKAQQLRVEIEDRQSDLDRAALRPQVEAFSGYEMYSERDPLVGPEFNHGYVVGLNARWNIFDGFATKGRLQATRARHDAAVQALQALRNSVASEVRSAFLDLQQSDRIMESETRNVQTADESLEIAKANVGAGLATQLDMLQAASDVTRTRTTRLGAIYQHNVAVAKLARACGVSPNELDFHAKSMSERAAKRANAVVDLTRPPQKLSKR